MQLDEFRQQLNRALAANETITFYCRCSLRYSGRAEAELADGDRAIIIKSDNTLLVHQPEGSSPINYMKNDSTIEVSDGEDSDDSKVILVKCYNSKFKDYLDIVIYEVYSFLSRKLEDGKKLTLVGTEKDMSDMIKSQPELVSRDFKPLSREEHTKFGFIDVFGHDKKGNLVIVECKRYTAGLDAVQQLRRYVEKVMELKGLSPDRVKGIIAAPSIAKNAEGMLKKWGFAFVHVHPPKRLERYSRNQKTMMEY